MRTRVLTGILPSLSTFPSCVSKMPQNQGVRPPHGHEPVSFLPHSGHNMNHINDLCRLCLGWCKGEMGPKPKHGGCVPSGGCEVYQIGYRIRLDTESDWIHCVIYATLYLFRFMPTRRYDDMPRRLWHNAPVPMPTVAKCYSPGQAILPFSGLKRP